MRETALHYDMPVNGMLAPIPSGRTAKVVPTHEAVRFHCIDVTSVSRQVRCTNRHSFRIHDKTRVANAPHEPRHKQDLWLPASEANMVCP